MTELIIGGSGSGKSRIAEKEAVRLYREGLNDPDEEDPGLIYLACMEGRSEEAKKRIKKHRENRRNQGFVTIERERDIGEALKALEKPCSGCTVLLEALSVLFANELFPAKEGFGDPYKTSEKVLEDLKLVKNSVRNLIIVSDDIFRDGREYGVETEGYMRGLMVLHRETAKFSDRVEEITAGIVTVWK